MRDIILSGTVTEKKESITRAGRRVLALTLSGLETIEGDPGRTGIAEMEHLVDFRGKSVADADYSIGTCIRVKGVLEHQKWRSKNAKHERVAIIGLDTYSFQPDNMRLLNGAKVLVGARNEVHLQGELTCDPTFKDIGPGLAELEVGVLETFMARGTPKRKDYRFKLECWADLCEQVAQWKKGDEVRCNGRLEVKRRLKGGYTIVSQIIRPRALQRL